MSGAEAFPTGAAGRDLPSWAPLAVLALVGGVLPIALAWHFGALGIPRNDDWSYVLSAFRFADSGELNGNGFAGKNLVGQFVMSLPVVWLFGHRIAALQVEVATFGVIGLIAVFDLAKQVLSPRRALFVAVMVAVGPMWASLSASYMSDIPAFALAMICLALGGRAARADDLGVGLFVVAMVVGFVGFTVREYALVAPIAVCLTALWTAGRWPRPRRSAVVGAFVGLVGVAALFYLWRRGLPGWQDNDPEGPSLAAAKSTVRLGAQSAVLIGLLVAPAVLLAGPRRVVSAAWARAPRISVVIGLVTVAGLGIEVVRQRAERGVFSVLTSFLGPGNYVMPNGTLGDITVAGDRPDLLPRSVLALLASAGVVAALLVVLAAVPPSLDALARLRQRRLGTPASPALALAMLGTIGFGVTSVLPALVGLPAFDRYLLFLVPLVGILVLRPGGADAVAPRGVRFAGGAALLALAALGLVYAANSASFDGTKWSVAEEVATSAGGPRHVEGGFEWTDYHAGKEIFLEERARPAGGFCVVLRAQSHRPGDREGLRAAAVWGPTGTHAWIVARQRGPC